MDEAMYRNILIATDGSALGDKSVSTGVALAKHLGATVTVVYVTEPWATDFPPELTKEPFWVKYNDACAARAATILDAAAQRAGDVGVACTVRHVPNSYPADGILETADACGCDLIIMSSHGRRGIARFVMGSQAQEVLVRSRLPVLICR
jgi:nucleotide-binding universal stress UspA family protein